MATGWRPKLRPEVETIHGPDGTVTGLRQPGTGHFVRIGRVSRALLPHLTGETSLEGLFEEITRLGMSAADATDALRALILLNFLEGAGDATIERLHTVYDHRPEIVALPESRFTCQGTGQCCRTYALGPLEEDDVARLEALDLKKAFPELGDGPYVRRDDQDSIYLERRDEHCVFLQSNALCGIHAKFGPEAKPKVCRLYPWNPQLTVAGMRVIDQSECSTFASSVRGGEPLAGAQLDRVRALFPERPEIHHPLVLLDAEHPCDYGWIVALEQKSQPILTGEQHEPMAALVAISRLTTQFAAALSSCPLEPGEPDATVARVLGAPLEVPDRVAPPTSDGLALLGEIVAALETAIEAKGLASPVIPGLRVVLTETRAVIEGRAPTASAPGEPRFVSSVLRASLRNAVFAGRLLCEGRLRAGIMRLALIPLFTVVGARLLARERQLERGGERELSEAHMIASVGLRTPSLQKTLTTIESRAAEVALAAAGLVRQLVG